MKWLITDTNRNLYWAFGLVAGSWSICLLISGIMWFVSNRMTNQHLPKVTRLQLQQFGTETSLRNYFSRNKAEQDLITNSPPDELPTTQESIQSSESATLRHNNFRDKILLTQSGLVAITGTDITGFEIINADVLSETWKLSLSDEEQLITAQIKNGQLILFTKIRVNDFLACPIPVFINNSSAEVDCGSVWHPNTFIESDSVFTILKVDPKTGEVIDKLAFTGKSEGSSASIFDAIYLTNTKRINQDRLKADFLTSDIMPLIPEELNIKLAQVMSLDISDGAKWTEINNLVDIFTDQMSAEDYLKWKAEYQRQLYEYAQIHKRELVTTIVTKVSLEDLTIVNNQEIPGRLLNQASIDEHEGILRLITAVGGRITSGNKTQYDLFILDSNLDRKGVLSDLLKNQRINSIVFKGNLGFIVTQSETDPVSVLDLYDVSNPRIAGKVNVPGFYSKLQLLNESLLLGIYKNEFSLKLSLFNITDPANPIEVDSISLANNTSELIDQSQNFFIDGDNKIFFLPTNQAGYIYTYQDSKLRLLNRINETQIDQAFSFNNNLYLLQNRRLSVLSYTDWKTVKIFKW